MRLFVAVDLDEPLRRAAARVARSVREGLEQAETYGVSWVSPDNFHLTLRFLGEVADATGKAIGEALAAPFTVPEFELALGGVGMFPPAGSARVIWLGLPRGADDLARLHAEVEQRLVPFNFPREDRPYRAHLTIARFRVPAPARVRQLVPASREEPIGQSTVRQVTLYRSQLSPKGAIYTPLVRGRLAGSRP